MGAARMMTRSARPGPSRESIVPLSVLTLAAVALGAIGSLGFVLGAVVAVGGVAISAALGWDPRWGARRYALLPVLLALGILALTAPPGPAPELLAGAGAVALLAGIAADPDRPPGGLARGAFGWGLPGLAVGLAWAGTYILPPSAAPVGVAGGLVAAAVVGLAVLIRRPDLAEPAPTL
jgi:hypothetical protein